MQSLFDAALAQDVAPFFGEQLVSVLIPLLLVVSLLIIPDRGVALKPAR